MSAFRFLTALVALLFIGAVVTATGVRAEDRYAFYDADGNVVQVIVGPLTPEQLAIFMADYEILFGAVSVEAVDSSVQIGDNPSATPSPDPGLSPEPTADPTPNPSADPTVAPCQ